MRVRQDLAKVARLGEPAAFRDPEEQARQPIGETATDEEQVVVLEFAKEFLRGVVGCLQCADKLQHVLVRDHIGGRGGEPAHEMIDQRALHGLRGPGRSTSLLGV